MMRTLHVLVCATLFCVALASVASAQCRDERGEPSTCAPAAPESPPAPAPAPAAVPATPPPPPAPPTVYERAGGYVELGFSLAALDLRRLHFTPQRPEWLPLVSRDLLVHGAVSADEALFGSLGLVLGARPTSFLRFPEVRFSFGGSDVDMGQPVYAGAGLDASIDRVFMVRLEVGAGIEAHVGMVGFYAMARAGVVGYFAEASLVHGALGDFGRVQLAEDAFELNWEPAASLDLEEGIALKATVEGFHLGAEGVASSFRFVGTF